MLFLSSQSAQAANLYENRHSLSPKNWQSGKHDGTSIPYNANSCTFLVTIQPFVILLALWHDLWVNMASNFVVFKHPLRLPAVKGASPPPLPIVSALDW